MHRSALLICKHFQEKRNCNENSLKVSKTNLTKTTETLERSREEWERERGETATAFDGILYYANIEWNKPVRKSVTKFLFSLELDIFSFLFLFLPLFVISPPTSSALQCHSPYFSYILTEQLPTDYGMIHKLIQKVSFGFNAVWRSRISKNYQHSCERERMGGKNVGQKCLSLWRHWQ